MKKRSFLFLTPTIIFPFLSIVSCSENKIPDEKEIGKKLYELVEDKKISSGLSSNSINDFNSLTTIFPPLLSLKNSNYYAEMDFSWSSDYSFVDVKISFFDNEGKKIINPENNQDYKDFKISGFLPASTELIIDTNQQIEKLYSGIGVKPSTTNPTNFIKENIQPSSISLMDLEFNKNSGTISIDKLEIINSNDIEGFLELKATFINENGEEVFYFPKNGQLIPQGKIEGFLNENRINQLFSTYFFENNLKKIILDETYISGGKYKDFVNQLGFPSSIITQEDLWNEFFSSPTLVNGSKIAKAFENSSSFDMFKYEINTNDLDGRITIKPYLNLNKEKEIISDISKSIVIEMGNEYNILWGADNKIDWILNSTVEIDKVLKNTNLELLDNLNVLPPSSKVGPIKVKIPENNIFINWNESTQSFAIKQSIKNTSNNTVIDKYFWFKFDIWTIEKTNNKEDGSVEAEVNIIFFGVTDNETPPSGANVVNHKIRVPHSFVDPKKPTGYNFSNSNQTIRKKINGYKSLAKEKIDIFYDAGGNPDSFLEKVKDYNEITAFTSSEMQQINLENAISFWNINPSLVFELIIPLGSKIKFEVLNYIKPTYPNPSDNKFRIAFDVKFTLVNVENEKIEILPSDMTGKTQIFQLTFISK